MPTKPSFFLLDAGPVIELHRIDLWRTVVTRCNLVIPSVVAEQEVQFWDSGEGVGRPITLSEDIDRGLIEVVSASAAEIAHVLSLFEPTFQDSIHAGELEALAVMLGNEQPSCSFCTADRMAVIALCLLGMSDRAASLEELLSSVGLGRELNLRFSASRMRVWVTEGQRRRIQGEGLAGQER